MPNRSEVPGELGITGVPPSLTKVDLPGEAEPQARVIHYIENLVGNLQAELYIDLRLAVHLPKEQTEYIVYRLIPKNIGQYFAATPEPVLDTLRQTTLPLPLMTAEQESEQSGSLPPEPTPLHRFNPPVAGQPTEHKGDLSPDLEEDVERKVVSFEDSLENREWKRFREVFEAALAEEEPDPATLARIREKVRAEYPLTRALWEAEDEADRALASLSRTPGRRTAQPKAPLRDSGERLHIRRETPGTVIVP